MCDFIELPNGTQIYSIGQEECLCGKTQEEILNYIISRLPKFEFDQKVIIERSCFGWHVKIK